jgi:hypothetical protein
MKTILSDRITTHPFTGKPVYQPRYVYEAVASDTATAKLPASLDTNDIIVLNAVPPGSTLLGFSLAFSEGVPGPFLLRAVETNISIDPIFIDILNGISPGVVSGHWSTGVDPVFFGYTVTGQADMDSNGTLVEDIQPMAFQLIALAPLTGIPDGASVKFSIIFQCGYSEPTHASV